MKILFYISIILVSGQLYSQDLVYKPKNPAFGGDTFNYQWMLSSAESQNFYKDPTPAVQQKTELQTYQAESHSSK